MDLLIIKQIDISITIFLNQLAIKNKELAFFFKFITHTGSGKAYPFYAIIIPFLFKEGIIISKFGLIAFAFQVPIYIASKNTIKRTRPDKQKNIKKLIDAPDEYSFPSGHCASSMLFALIINQYIPSLSIYFVIWMGIIIVSRMALGVHYFSDTIGGIVLGLVSFYIANQLAPYF